MLDPKTRLNKYKNKIENIKNIFWLQHYKTGNKLKFKMQKYKYVMAI